MNFPASLQALRFYNFRLYFFGQAISLVGTWMQRIAISWLVYKLTQSAFMLGLVGFASQIPVLLLSPYAGAFVDRHSRFKTLLFTQVASMVQAGLLFLLIWKGYTGTLGIIFLSIVLGIINAFDTPSRQSLMIVLVRDKKYLPNAIALNSSMVTLARLIGPAIAGILLSSYGEDVCFFINFISFIAVIASLLFMRLKIPPKKVHEEQIWHGLAEGFNYLKGDIGLRSSILLMAVISFVLMPYSNLLPIYASTIFKGDVTTFSWLNSISGLGALAGAIYMANLQRGANLLKQIAFSGLVFAMNMGLFAFTTHLPTALLFVFIGEAGMLSQIASTNTYVQTNVAENMRGRVISYYVMAFQGMQPLGSLLIGWLAHITSAPITIFVEAVISVIAILLFIPTLNKARILADQKIVSANKQLL